MQSPSDPQYVEFEVLSDTRWPEADKLAQRRTGILARANPNFRLNTIDFQIIALTVFDNSGEKRWVPAVGRIWDGQGFGTEPLGYASCTLPTSPPRPCQMGDLDRLAQRDRFAGFFLPHGLSAILLLREPIERLAQQINGEYKKNRGTL